MPIETAPRTSIETGAETEPTVEDLGSLTPDSMVSPTEVTVGEPLIITSEDVAEKSGDTTGLDDIDDIVKVGSTGRAYRLKPLEDGSTTARFISNYEVDTIRANQDQIRDGVSELNALEDREGAQRNPDRLVVGALDDIEVTIHKAAERVSAFLVEKRDNMAERRTASEVVSEIGDKASGVWESAKTSASEQLEKGQKAVKDLGKKAGSKLVEVVTAPSRGADRLFDAAERGMDKIEARAKSAQERKTRRLSERRTRNNIRRITKNAERNMRDRNALQKETAKNRAIAEKREAKSEAREKARNLARQKAEAARNQKANRRFERAKQSRESREELAKKAAERAERVKSSAKRAGRRAVDAASGAASIFEATSSEVHKRGSEAVETAKSKAKAKRNKFYNSQAAKAADRAERFYNKTASEGETIRVVPKSERSEV